MERPHRLATIATLGSAALLFLLFYPGGMSIDSYFQLLQARTGSYGDWHPPFMAWIWGWLDWVLRGPVLMLVGQITLMLGALAAFASAALRASATVRRGFVALTLWVTPISGIVGTIWKDVWTSGLLLLGVACCLRAGAAQGIVRQRWLFVGGVASYLGALLFRPNAVFAVFPLLACGIWILAGSRRSVRAGAVAVVVAAAGTIALGLASAAVNRSLTSDRSYPIQSIVLFDVVGVSLTSGRTDFLDDAAPQLREVTRGRSTIDALALRKAYYPSSWTALVFELGAPLSTTTSPAEVDTLISVWWRCVREEPQAYLSHRAAVFLQVIGAHGGPLYAPVYFGVPPIPPDREWVEKTFPGEFPQVSPLQQLLRTGLERTTGWLVYRPWFWLVANVALLAAVLTRAPRRFDLVAIGVSGLLGELSLFFIAPSADYRYSHWLVLSTWLVAAALAVDLVRRHPARAAGGGESPSDSRNR